MRMDVVKEKFTELDGKYEYVTVEGSGGILCPICFDEEKIQLEDVVDDQTRHERFPHIGSCSRYKDIFTHFRFLPHIPASSSPD